MAVDLSIDVGAAQRFLTTHARLLDRHRFRIAIERTEASALDALDALGGYRNDDGGYGWGLEPDLRAPESQPGGALHAFEVFDEAGAVGVTSPRAAQLCDWLGSVALEDGGVPFAFPVADPAGCAPFWAEADPTVSSLQLTAAVTGPALRAARSDPAVAAHPWLARSVEYCLATIAATPELAALEALFSFAVLDVLADRDDDTGTAARDQLDRLAATLPDSGVLAVEGGAPDEAIRPIELAPFPGPARDRFDDDVIASELARLAGEQRDDGGWTVDFGSFSPSAELEWRGYATVKAVRVLATSRPG